jgi:hypothetical protein
MNFVLLAVCIAVLWLWVRGNPVGALGMFAALVFTVGPATHPDWSWTNQNDIPLIALLAVIALAPFAIRDVWRHGGLMGWIDGNLVPPPKDPDKARYWSPRELDARIQVWCDAQARAAQEPPLSPEDAQLRRGCELLGCDWQAFLKARAERAG